jgi:hypothetical protein
VARIAAPAMEARLPTFSATEGVLNAPAPILAGLVSSYYTIGQFAGHKAAQVLGKGTRARDIPIETLSRYSFVVRMEVAKTLGFLPPRLALQPRRHQVVKRGRFPKKGRLPWNTCMHGLGSTVSVPFWESVPFARFRRGRCRSRLPPWRG